MSIYKILDQEIVYDTLYYVDPTNGSADNDGQSAEKALKCPEDANVKDGTGIFLFVFVEGQHLIKPDAAGKVEYFTTNRTSTAFFVANPRKTKLTFDFANVPQPSDTDAFDRVAHLVRPRAGVPAIYTLIGLDILADSSGTRKNIGGICATGNGEVVKAYNCRFFVCNDSRFNNRPSSHNFNMFKGNSIIAENCVFKNIGNNIILPIPPNGTLALSRCLLLSWKDIFATGIFNINNSILIDTALNNGEGNIIDSTALVDANGYLYRGGELAEQTAGVMQGVYNWELFDYGLDVPDIAMSTTLDVFDYSPPPEKYSETDGYSEIEGAEFAKQTRTAINVNKTDIFGLNREFLKLGWKAEDITASLEAHKADIAPHGAAATPAEGHIPLYKEGGVLAVASPIANEDAANKGYTDDLVAPVAQTAAQAAADTAALNQSVSGLNAAVTDFNARIIAAENAADNALTTAQNAAGEVNGLQNRISDNTLLINVRTERPGHDFGTAAPTDEEITAFALSHFYGYPPEEEGEEEEPVLEDGTAVINLFNSHFLLYRPPGSAAILAASESGSESESEPAVNDGSWEDCGLAFVKVATDTALGAVKGSSEEGKASVNADGEIVLNITDINEAISANSAAIVDIYSAQSTLEGQIDAVVGKLRYMPAQDFGTAAPAQQDLSDYTLAHTGLTAVGNSTSVINLFDGREWIYNEVGNEWVSLGDASVATATNTSLGVVKGSSDTGKVSVDGVTGEMTVNVPSFPLSIANGGTGAIKSLGIGGALNNLFGSGKPSLRDNVYIPIVNGFNCDLSGWLPFEELFTFQEIADTANILLLPNGFYNTTWGSKSTSNGYPYNTENDCMKLFVFFLFQKNSEYGNRIIFLVNWGGELYFRSQNWNAWLPWRKITMS
jgi:hypothetical protein